jgi:hypothetical protein
MIDAGYMAKIVAGRPEIIRSASIKDVYSLASCVSKPCVEDLEFEARNRFGLFSSRDKIFQLAEKKGVDLSQAKLFYYELFEQEFDEITRKWTAFELPSFDTMPIMKPAKRNLEGFDCLNFSADLYFQCSPLSCNGLADKLKVNEHCLFPSLEAAKQSLESGEFDHTKPGPYRIFAVYTVGREF